MRLFCIFLIACLTFIALPSLAVPAAHAQSVAAATPQPTASFDIQAATQTYLDSVPAAQRIKTDAYFQGGYWINLWSALITVMVMAALMFSGASARMRDIAQRVTRFRFVHALIYGALFIAALSLLTLPFTIYTDYFREHQYGFSNLSFGGWLREEVTGVAVSVIAGAIAIAVIYAVIARAPRNWWLWGAVASVVLVSVMALIAPVFIAPLFNEYKPVANPQVRDAVLSMARANGVPAKEIYEFNASKQHKRISANVSGFGGTMRISLNDNLLTRTTLAETRMVMAHEIGHYVLNHVYKRLILFGLVIVAMFAFSRWVFAWAIARWGGRFGVRDVNDLVGLPVLVAAFTVFSLLATPVNNTITRVQEAEADLFGLNASREPDAFARAALMLGEYRKLDPGPLEELIFFSHPSGRSRITMAMQWKAEQVRPVTN